MSYYNNSTNTLVNGTTADADEVEGKFNEVVAGFNAAEADIDKKLELTNADHTTRAISENAVARSNKLIGFDSNGDLAVLDGSSQSWGGIQGTLANQTDLQNELDAIQAEVDINTAKVGVTTEEANTIDSVTAGEPTGSDVVLNVVSLTQAEYDAGTPIATTLYIING